MQQRTVAEYLTIVGELDDQGFQSFKCAPFEAVDDADNAVQQAAAGMMTLGAVRERYPAIGLRVDFHERFTPASPASWLPDLERLNLDWIEDPYPMGPAFTDLRQSTRLPVAAGVIMPNVKHVGGFGPLLDVMRMAEGRAEVSPHNPSGPISTAASLHAAAVRPDAVRSFKYAFDRIGTRRATGERVENGRLILSDRPGWGINPRV